MPESQSHETRGLPERHKGAGPISRCLAIVTDLVFGSKITQAARTAGIEAVVTHDPAKISQIAASGQFHVAILDLDVPDLAIGRVVAAIRAGHPDLPIIAFMPHTRTDLADAARRAGVDKVLARSAFVSQLPTLFTELASAREQRE